MYSTPLTYKSLENPTSLFDNAEESSANALATNFNPTHQQSPPNPSFCGKWRNLDKRTFYVLVLHVIRRNYPVA